MKEKNSNFRGVEVVEVLRISVNEGNGTAEDPIYREVFYVTFGGDIIGHKSKEPIRKFAGQG